MKGKKFDEEGIKESGLVEVLYLAIVDPLLKAIGITDPGVPFFVWSELGYESIMLQIGIDNFIKDIEK